MIRFVLFAVLSFCMLSATAQERKEYDTDKYRSRRAYFKENPIKQNIDIIFLGNSLTEGGKWSEYFPQVDIANRGIVGDNTEGILNRIDEIIEAQPSNLFILTGVNDISQNLSNKVIIKNYKEIIKQVKAGSPNTHIYIQSLLPINNDFGRYKRLIGKEKQVIDLNKGLAKMAKKEKLPFINLYPLFLDNSQKLEASYTNDGLHLNADGYKIWVNELNQYIK